MPLIALLSAAPISLMPPDGLHPICRNVAENLAFAVARDQVSHHMALGILDRCQFQYPPLSPS